MSNAHKCILADLCKTAGNPDVCNDRCPFFNNLHTGSMGLVNRANIPRDYQLLTIDTSPARDAKYAMRDGDEVITRPISDALRQYVATFKRQFEDGAEAIKSLYLYSPSPGTGKTTTAAVLANGFIRVHYLGSKRRNLRPLDRPAYFLSMNRWHSKFHEFNRRNVPDHIGEPAAAEYYEAHEIAKNVPFLVIDDIGVRQASDAFNMDVLDLVDHRVSNRLPTVYTSNVPVTMLSELYDDRVFDRVRDLCLTLEFVGDSHRGMTR